MNQDIPEPLQAPPRAWQGFLMGLAAYATYNIGDVLIKKLTVAYSLFQIVSLTIFLSLPLIYIFVRWHSGPKCMNSVSPRIQVLRGLLFFTYTMTGYYGVQHLPLPSYYTFIFITPLFTVLFSVLWLKERVTRQQIILLALSFLGIMIAFHPNPHDINVSAVIVLAGAIAAAFGQIIIRRQSYGDGLGASIIYPEAVCVVLAAAVGFHTFHWPDKVGWLLFGGAAILSAIANSLLVLAFYRAPASQVTPTQYSQIIWGTIFGYLFFAEIPEWWVILGAGIVMIGSLGLARIEYLAAQGTVPHG